MTQLLHGLHIAELSSWRWNQGRRTLAQVSVEPHRAQKPRSTPGEELYFAMAPSVIVTASFSNETKAFAGASLCRRQLSQ